MGLEQLLEQAGGLGRFQAATLAVLFMARFFGGWSMFHMAFAGIVPDFYCNSDSDVASHWLNSTLNTCSPPDGNNSDASCDSYSYAPGAYATVINEWDLVCDNDWVKAALTSIQMAGLLVGCLTAGQLGDMIGRRYTNMGFVVLHCMANIGAAFTQSWEAFAVCRFLVGAGIGGILVTAFVYMVEFTPTKWRPLCATIPAWASGVGVFSLVAWLLQDWRKLHLICGVGGLVQVPLLFLIPESLRWSSVQGRLEEAEATLNKMLRWNRAAPIPNAKAVLQAVAEEGRDSHDGSTRYTYLDVIRPWATARVTLTMCYHWFCFSLAYYGISFGVSSLAGNVFFNIFLLGMVEVPLQIAALYTMNKIGRKWSALPMVFLACACAVACMTLQILGLGGNGSMVITFLSVLAKVAVAVSWVCVQIWGSELYPTVTRNLGTGVANTSARVAGILAPQIINFDNAMTRSYIIITCLLVIDMILVIITRDTRGDDLKDSLHEVKVTTERQNQVKVGAMVVPDPVKGEAESSVGKGQANGDMSVLNGKGPDHEHDEKLGDTPLDAKGVSKQACYTNEALVEDDHRSSTGVPQGDTGTTEVENTPL